MSQKWGENDGVFKLKNNNNLGLPLKATNLAWQILSLKCLFKTYNYVYLCSLMINIYIYISITAKYQGEKVIKSSRFYQPCVRVKCGKGRRKWYKYRVKCILESRIEFPDPNLLTCDTPHEPNTKFLKKCRGYISNIEV